MAAIIDFLSRKIYLFFVLALVTACGQEEHDDEHEEALPAHLVEVPAAQLPQLRLGFAKAQPRSFTNTVSARGRVDVPPQQVAKVNAQLPGYVQGLSLYVGMQVKKGQVLCRLSHPDIAGLREQYQTARAQVETSRSELDRQQKLQQAEFGSAKEVEAARVRYQADLAQLNSLEQRLKAADVRPGGGSNVTVVAPLSGTLAAVNVSVGELVSPGTTLFEIVNKDHLHLELQLYERDSPRVRNGQQVLFSVPAAGVANARAHVVVAAGVLNMQTRQLQVHGHLEDEDLPLVPGQYVEAQIILDSSQVTAIPAAALIQEDGHAFVFATTEQKTRFEMLPVKVAQVQGDWVGIQFLDANHAKRTLVTTNAYLLQNIRRTGGEEDDH